ncbi:MAG: 5'-nucleosidase [Pseudobdellovibrionaceae bacterium]
MAKKKYELIKNKICLIMAMEMESQGVFESRGIYPFYCDIGKVNAAYAALKAIHDGAKIILNLGTAGSHRFPTHDIVHVRTFVQRDFDLTPLGMPLGQIPVDQIPGAVDISFLPNKVTAICGTGDCFQVGPPKLSCDLVDMEGYAIAKVCALEKTPMYSVKYITDGSDENAHNDWRANLKISSIKLFESLEEFLQTEVIKGAIHGTK